MANRPQVNKDVSGDWKVGDVVNIGTLRGLVVTGLTQEGSLTKFTLRHPSTSKEYSFVPGGLRKTYEPPTQTVPDLVGTTKAIDKARSILNNQCRRHADAAMRAQLQEVIALLSSTAVERSTTAMEETAAPFQVSRVNDF